MADEARPLPFHERFNFDVGTVEARRRFMNRINNVVFEEMSDGAWSTRLLSRGLSLYDVTRFVAFALGERTPNHFHPAMYVQDDFFRCLHVLEAIYKCIEGLGLEDELSNDIQLAFNASEVDLGVEWRPPVFMRTGAQLLDERLVNDALRWLRAHQYKSVLDPFEKGLAHYLEAMNRPERLADVITDMYEATEALAKVATGKDRDLSKNREVFIKSLRVSEYYKRLLKDYIAYGSEFRHAERLGKPRPPLSEPEVESFIYLTGLFIRLVMRTT